MSKGQRQHGSPEFYAALEAMADLHEKKSHDYGSGEDPLANCKSSESFGVPAWVGVMIRIGDKVQRIKSFLEKGSLANESLEDALMDQAVYSVIALVLYRQSNKVDSESWLGCIPSPPSAVKIHQDTRTTRPRETCHICNNPNCDNPNQKH